MVRYGRIPALARTKFHWRDARQIAASSVTSLHKHRFRCVETICPRREICYQKREAKQTGLPLPRRVTQHPAQRTRIFSGGRKFKRRHSSQLE